jgi:hypothetical protein
MPARLFNSFHWTLWPQPVAAGACVRSATEI